MNVFYTTITVDYQFLFIVTGALISLLIQTLAHSIIKDKRCQDRQILVHELFPTISLYKGRDRFDGRAGKPRQKTIPGPHQAAEITSKPMLLKKPLHGASAHQLHLRDSPGSGLIPQQRQSHMYGVSSMLCFHGQPAP